MFPLGASKVVETNLGTLSNWIHFANTILNPNLA